MEAALRAHVEWIAAMFSGKSVLDHPAHAGALAALGDDPVVGAAPSEPEAEGPVEEPVQDRAGQDIERPEQEIAE